MNVMVSSFIPGRGRLIVLPLQRKIRGGVKSADLKRELSNLRGELRFVENAIAALERLAVMRFSEPRSGQRQAGVRA